MTTGAFCFDSGYTTKACTVRLSCLIDTHSWWRGDFSKVCLAQSCDQAMGMLSNKAAAIMRVRFMAQSLLLLINADNRLTRHAVDRLHPWGIISTCPNRRVIRTA